jgi:hypothetical protein
MLEQKSRKIIPITPTGRQVCQEKKEFVVSLRGIETA